VVNFRPKCVDEKIGLRSILPSPHALQDWLIQITEIHGEASTLEGHTRSRAARRFHLQYVGGNHQISEDGFTSQQGSDG